MFEILPLVKPKNCSKRMERMQMYFLAKSAPAQNNFVPTFAKNFEQRIQQNEPTPMLFDTRNNSQSIVIKTTGRIILSFKFNSLRIPDTIFNF